MDNMKNTKFIRKLPVPKDIKAQYPLSEEATVKKEARDKEIRPEECISEAFTAWRYSIRKTLSQTP